MILGIFLFSTFNLFARSFTCVLFGWEGGISLVAVVLILELLAYSIFKVATLDLRHWAPLYWCKGWTTTILLRVLIKIVTDWTARVQFRSPQDVGGAYFIFNLFSTLAMALVSAEGYEEIVGAGVGNAWEGEAERSGCSLRKGLG